MAVETLTLSNVYMHDDRLGATPLDRIWWIPNGQRAIPAAASPLNSTPRAYAHALLTRHSQCYQWGY